MKKYLTVAFLQASGTLGVNGAFLEQKISRNRFSRNRFFAEAAHIEPFMR